MNNDISDLCACPGCDLLQRMPALPPGGNARCLRCHELLAIRPRQALDLPLALTLAAAVVFIIANMRPLMDLSAVGHQASTTIVGGAYQMWLHGFETTAVLIAFCAVIAPLAYITFLLCILLPLRRPPAPDWVGTLMHWAEIVRPWSMLEVMLLGILVALTKIAELAIVVPGVGMVALGVLIVLFSAIPATFDFGEAWTSVAWVQSHSRSHPPAIASGAERPR